MRITVFGGGGFIGSNIVDRLLRDKHEVRVFERLRVDPYRQFSDSEKVLWMTGDLTSMHDVTEAIDGCDVIVHLVSTTLPKSSNDDPIYDVQSNLVATLQMLNVMVSKKVKKIVFISSGGTVYGDPVYLPIDERHPTNPKVSYGITKLAIEKYLLLYQHQYGIKANILRVANPYGERQRVQTAQGAIAAFLDKALRKETFEVWGDGTVTRDYLYIADVAEAFSMAVQYDGSESVFNISSGRGTSLNEIIEKIESILGHPVERTYCPARPFDVPASVLDNTLARRELGWEPKIDLDTGIQMTAGWLRSQVRERP
ncbi:NAD-dependent epimerase/dehydratase family protein [Caballeronia sp. GAOx1]|uniref:NAD-dependent epimerase/dehydratase family protein n=1 Tax=Caballeronia sp. GAOx1 TaxID=2921761 RepID=UPI0020297257|nr:NAD-dependent epimerase/dehydratase family protein [Caballeronia sp. GAOx1]